MTKEILRREYLIRRLEMHAADVDQRSGSIAERCMDLISTKPFEVIHLFLPLAEKKEIDTWKMIAALRSSYPRVSIAIPRVVPGSREMQHFRYENDTVFIKNRWGIPEPEPVPGRQISPEDIDLTLIPLLVFDQQGYRVGYGGGYYDRFLAQCRPDAVKIGLSFFEPLDRIEDTDQYDIPLDYCVTPQRVWSWKNDFPAKDILQ